MSLGYLEKKIFPDVPDLPDLARSGRPRSGDLARSVPMEISHLQENQDFQEKSKNQEKSVRTKVDKHPETAWAPFRIGSGVKICGFGGFLGLRMGKSGAKSSVWFSPLWPSSAPPAVWTAFTHFGARKALKATYFHPRTYPEGYPGGFGVFRGTGGT